MTSEIRTNTITSRAGLSTVTFTDSGPMFSGITTFVDNSGFNIGTGSSIFSPATNTLTFGTNSNERVRITSTGAINLTSENTTGWQLDAGDNSAAYTAIDNHFPTTNRTLYLNNETTHRSIVFWNKNGSDGYGFGLDNSGNFKVVYSTNERLRIASNGQVSISSDGTTDGLLTIKGDSDQVGTPSIRLLDGSDTREVSITNTSGDFVASVHGNDNAIHGHIKMFESGIIDFNNGGASGSNTNRLRIDTSGRVSIGDNNTQTAYPFYVAKDLNTGGNLLAFGNVDSTYSQSITLSFDSNKDMKWAGGSGSGGLIWDVGTRGYSFKIGGSEKVTIDNGGRVAIGAIDTSYGQLNLSIPAQSGGAALQVMNTAAGSGDGSLTNIVLRSVNSAGSQWSMAEYRAQYHMFSNQGTEAFRTAVSGDYGSIETRSTKNAYGGYGIVAGGANHVFMGDGGGAGLYNDTNNGWYIYGTKGGDTYLYSNGSPTFRSYVTGDYGCVQTTGTKNGWGGLSISGQYVFMSDGGACGIYNDIDNEWMTYFARNGAFILYHNGVGVLTSDGSGPIVPGGHHFKINAGTWTGEHVGKIQYHSNNLYNQYSSYWIARNASGTNTFTIDSSGNFSSDARKKENITTVTDALTKVSQLRGVEFNWKEKYGSKQDMGLIAQEVETVFPRLISDSPDPEGAEKENEDGTPMKMMNYNGLFAVTVEAMKELKAKIETLEQENIALRARVTNLEGN